MKVLWITLWVLWITSAAWAGGPSWDLEDDAQVEILNDRGIGPDRDMVDGSDTWLHRVYVDKRVGPDLFIYDGEEDECRVITDL